MCLSNGGVTLRNGHRAYARNGFPGRSGTAASRRAERRPPAERIGGPAVTADGSSSAGWPPGPAAPAATTFVIEARWYAQIARVAAIVGNRSPGDGEEGLCDEG